MLNKKLNKYFKIIALALLSAFYGSVSLYKIILPKADDIARHLKNGQLILQGNFDILYRNVYSYTQTNFPVVNHHWLSGVIYYLLYLIIGWDGLVIFKVILLIATLLLLIEVAVKKASFWLVAFFSIPTILILMERTTLRPENFSYFLMVIFLYLILDLEKNPKSKKFYWLIPLQVLWVNLHIFFFIGPLLIGAFLVEKIILRFKNFSQDPLVRKLSLVFIAVLIACLINPNFINGALYPLNIFNNYGFQVAENASLFQYFRTANFWDDFAPIFYIPAVILLFASFIFGFFKKEKPIFFFLVSVATAIAGFKLLRNIALFGIIFLPAITNNLNDVFISLKEKFKHEAPRVMAVNRIILPIFLFVITIWLTFHFTGGMTNYGIGLDYRSEEAAKFFKENALKGPIFNDYDIGSYIVFNFYPVEKVWMDNRPEAYSSAFLNEVSLPLVSDEKAWKKAMEKYKFNTIFFYQYDRGQDVRNFLYRRMHDKDWALVYVDVYSFILIRNVPQNEKVIKKFQITPDNAAEKLAYLENSKNYDDRITAADTFNLLGLGDLATKTFFDVLSKDANRPKVWMVLGEWELDKSDYRSPLLAMMFLDKAISLGYKTAESYYYLGAAYAKLNRLENARLALEKSLQINPNWQDSKNLLNRLNENNK